MGVNLLTAALRAILRPVVVAFGFLVEQLRRIPGARQIERRAPWIVSGLMLAAVAALAR